MNLIWQKKSRHRTHHALFLDELQCKVVADLAVASALVLDDQARIAARAVIHSVVSVGLGVRERARRWCGAFAHVSAMRMAAAERDGASGVLMLKLSAEVASASILRRCDFQQRIARRRFELDVGLPVTVLLSLTLVLTEPVRQGFAPFLGCGPHRSPPPWTPEGARISPESSHRALSMSPRTRSQKIKE